MIKKWLFGCSFIGLVFYFTTVAYVHLFDAEQAKAHSITANTENQQIYNLLYKKGCNYCHTPNAKLPFYATLPIAKQLMENDITMGLAYFNLTETLSDLRADQSVPEVSLAKIQQVVQQDQMPPLSYKMLHWAAGLSKQEKQQLLDWIADQRLKYYSSGLADQQHQTAMLQPIPDSLPTDPAKVALGFKLYHATQLSDDNSISCNSCHLLDKGGVDGLPTSTGVRGQKGGINSPTVFNAVFNRYQFWDGRAATLQEQAGGPPMNPIEMGSKSWDEIIAKLQQDPQLQTEFLQVYPQGFSDENITDAIAEFEKTLITPNSPLDRHLKGDQQALTAQQQRGYHLFIQEGCATCHVGKNIGGQSFEPIGRAHDYFADRKTPLTHEDLGRFNVTQDPQDKYLFKTPSLRNIALTAPYFHDAQAKDLPEAVTMMLYYQYGKTLPEQDINDIVAFLQSLTGKYTPAALTH